MSYTINRNYISKGNSRSGAKISKVRFIVAHDTGNPGSSAAGNRSYFQNSQPSASAHTFIDHKEILEIVPLDEKAWHVLYQKPLDNQMFGDDANDAAIGVELCYGGSIDNKEAYKRYVWYMKYLCDKFGLDPKKHIVGHYTLDPGRKTDPMNAFKLLGITWNDFISDVAGEKVTSSAVKTSTKSSIKSSTSGKAGIKAVQKWANQYKEEAKFSKLTEDGINGPKTMDALLRICQYFGKTSIDGLWGPKTKASVSTQSMSVHQAGWTRLVQATLVCLGYNVGSSGIDGKFGNDTRKAVAAYQRSKGITADGIAGPNTFEQFFKSA